MLAKLSYSVLPRCAKQLLSAFDAQVFLDEFMASYQFLHSLQSRPSKKPQQKSCNKGYPVKIRKALTNFGAVPRSRLRNSKRLFPATLLFHFFADGLECDGRFERLV